jgi:uncharacterized protein (DUF362 family)
MRTFVRPGERVLVKPNFLLSDRKPGVTTTGEVIVEVTRLVLEAGAKPIIGEAGSIATGLDAFRNVGAFDFATQHGVPMKNLNEDEMVEVEIPDAKVLPKVKVAKTVLEVDRFISLPVLKTHDQCWVSFGIKNIKGILPMSEKMRSHQVGVEQAIVDLNRRFPPTLVVIDGIYGLEGLGPANGDPVPMDLIIAGANPLATDLVATQVIGLDPKRVKHLRYAIQAGIGPKGVEEVRVLGDSIQSVQRKFKTAQQAVEEQYREMGIEVVARNVCSGCWAEFRHIYYELKEQREKLKGYVFVLGSVKNPPRGDKVVVLGNCAKEAAPCGEYCAGCPPHHDEIAAVLRKKILQG